MNVQAVVDLVRAGHQFVGLSPKSMERLSEMRQILTVVPTFANTTDPHSSELVSCDDDALIEAIYRNFCGNAHQHSQLDADLMLAVVVSKEKVVANNIGRPRPFVVRGEAPAEVPGSPRRLIEAPAAASATDDATAAAAAASADSGAAAQRADTTFGGMFVFDRPLTLPTLRGTAPGPSIALLRHGLSNSAIHRCSIQVLTLPPLRESVMPACTFGIVSKSIVDDAGVGEWIGVAWRVGTSLPCAAHLVTTTTSEQPIIRGAVGHVFIHVGDVITIELRPREPTRTAAAVNNKYHARLAEQRKSLDLLAEEPVSVDCFAFVNGVLIGEMRDIQQYQPIAPSNKYRAVYDKREDPKGNERQHARGFPGCRFAVQLCGDATVAVYGASGAAS